MQIVGTAPYRIYVDDFDGYRVEKEPLQNQGVYAFYMAKGESVFVRLNDSGFAAILSGPPAEGHPGTVSKDLLSVCDLAQYLKVELFRIEQGNHRWSGRREPKLLETAFFNPGAFIQNSDRGEL